MHDFSFYTVHLAQSMFAGNSSILYFPIVHNSFCLPPNFVVECPWEVCIFSIAFHDNSLCKILVGVGGGGAEWNMGN